MLRVGVLASGSGTNLAALIAAQKDGRLGATIAAVICNVPGAKALDRARDAEIPAILVDHKAHASRETFEAEIQRQLEAHGVDLVVLAGFMRILSPGFVSRWHGRIVNVHPSLLPSFPGMHAIRQALAAGVRFTGCTVHLVDEGTDTGPVLAQAAVPVLPDDDEASLHARVQKEEHRLLPWVVRLFAEGRIRLVEGRPVLDLPGSAWASSSTRNPEPEQA
jgi:phosphoribosylglycinamide formyltransferase-1